MAKKPIASFEQRRARILDAAREIFLEDGSLDGGLRAIAAKAGYTTGAIYKLFSGKDEIYAALLEDSLVELSRAAALAAATHADPEEALHAAAMAFVQYYQSRRFEYLLGLYLFERNGKKGLGSKRDHQLNALLDQAIAVFQTCFQQLGGSWMTPDRARDLAHALFAALAGILAIYFSQRDRSLKTSWQKILDTTLSAFIHQSKDNSVI